LAIDDMSPIDFSLPVDRERPNKIVAAVFSSLGKYLDGDSSALVPELAAEPWEFHARAFLHLLASPGRNEPDDRISAIEVVFDSPVPLRGNLKALILPHTLWDSKANAPWLRALHESGVQISPYLFVPGRHPDYYQALVDAAVRDLYRGWGIL
jgi:hypothetical protein